ncbi:MAG: hypothetical protein H6581_19880 [Bacteroidia bacterium]|nr:hypothetical protein [Bacteroidia bacterium]
MKTIELLKTLKRVFQKSPANSAAAASQLKVVTLPDNRVSFPAKISWDTNKAGSSRLRVSFPEISPGSPVKVLGFDLTFAREIPAASWWQVFTVTAANKGTLISFKETQHATDSLGRVFSFRFPTFWEDKDRLDVFVELVNSDLFELLGTPSTGGWVIIDNLSPDRPVEKNQNEPATNLLSKLRMLFTF